MKNLLKNLEKQHSDLIKEFRKMGFVCEDRKGNGYPETHLILEEKNSVAMSHEMTESDIDFQLGILEMLQDIIGDIKFKFKQKC